MADDPKPVRVIMSQSQVCRRQDFAGQPVGATCSDCHHAIAVHIGAESCAMCRLEWQLTPAYWRLQARIHGRRWP